MILLRMLIVWFANVTHVCSRGWSYLRRPVSSVSVCQTPLNTSFGDVVCDADYISVGLLDTVELQDKDTERNRKSTQKHRLSHITSAWKYLVSGPLTFILDMFIEINLRQDDTWCWYCHEVIFWTRLVFRQRRPCALRLNNCHYQRRWL